MRSIRLRPWFRWVLPRLVCATLIYVGSYTAFNAWLSAGLAAEVAAIRERGEPVSAEELVHPEVPTELDAGPYFRGACALMEGLADPLGEELGDFWPQVEEIPDADPTVNHFGWVDSESTPVEVEGVDAWLRETPGLQVLLDEVGRRSRCRSTVRFEEDGPYTLLPHLMPAKQLTLVVLASSSAAASRGDAQRAVAQHELSYDLARCVYADRFCLISALVGVAMEGLSHAHLQLLLSGDTLGEAELAQLDASLAGLPDLEQVYRESLLGERAGLGAFTFEALLEGRYVPFMGEVPAATGALRLLVLADFRYYLQELGKGARVPWGEPFDERQLHPGYAVLSGMIMPAQGKFRARLKRTEVRREVGRCALALERERLVSGGYPASLPSRFAAQGFAYERVGGGFTLTAPHAEEAPPDEVVRFRVVR